jgi:hypothetical protein
MFGYTAFTLFCVGHFISVLEVVCIFFLNLIYSVVVRDLHIYALSSNQLIVCVPYNSPPQSPESGRPEATRKIMTCDCLPIVGVQQSEIPGQNFQNDKNFSADRPFNRRSRRAGTGK